MKLQRTRNAVRNIISGILNKIVGLFLPFVIRTIMIQEMGAEYLGLSSLFGSILQILNLTELGFGTAMVFSLYKPIAKNDNDTICEILNLYKNIYRIIGGIILGIGLILTPGIKYLISGAYPNDVNIYILYIIYLFNTAISYLLFAYKGAILAAYQRGDIENNLNMIAMAAMYFIQIAVIFAFHNYYIYVIFFPLTSIAINFIRAIIVNKMYPQYKCKGQLSKEAKKEIFKKVGALFGHKLSFTVTTACDTMVISAFLGLTSVAVYNNYFYIVNAINGFLIILSGSVTAGVGNSIETETVEKNYTDFKKLLFMYQWIFSWCTVCLVCLYQHFMYLWVGRISVEYMLPFYMVILFNIYFYSVQIRRPMLVYKDANGYWWADRYKPYVGIVVNLVSNIILVKCIGMAGVLISTIFVSIIYLPWETYVVFKNYFKRSSKEYYIELLKYTFIMIAICCITYGICGIFSERNYANLFIKLAICIVVPNVLFVLAYRKSSYYLFYLEKIKALCKNKII